MHKPRRSTLLWIDLTIFSLKKVFSETDRSRFSSIWQPIWDFEPIPETLKRFFDGEKRFSEKLGNPQGVSDSNTLGNGSLFSGNPWRIFNFVTYLKSLKGCRGLETHFLPLKNLLKAVDVSPKTYFGPISEKYVFFRVLANIFTVIARCAWSNSWEFLPEKHVASPLNRSKVSLSCRSRWVVSAVVKIQLTTPFLYADIGHTR